MAHVVGRHRALEDRDLEGLVMLDDDVIGSFDMNEDGLILLTLESERPIIEVLEFAGQNGIPVGLMLKPKLT